MFDWLYSSALFGVFIALFPIAYVVGKAIRQQKRPSTTDIKDQVKEAILATMIAGHKPEKCDKPHRQSSGLIDDEQLQLIRGTVDLITYRLSLIESSIYKEVNPMPHLSPEEYIAAALQMRDVVRRFKHMPSNSVSMAMEP